MLFRSELSRYLNRMTTATAEFTQVNPDGSISTGTVFIQRPGRVRFEYNNDNTLVMASGGNVAVFDPKSGGPQQYPLSKTPLKLLLSNTIDLSSKMVRDVREELQVVRDAAAEITVSDGGRRTVLRFDYEA